MSYAWRIYVGNTSLSQFLCKIHSGCFIGLGCLYGHGVRAFPPGVAYAGHSLSELVSTGIVNDAAFLLGCSKRCWTQGYWSSSSTADDPIKSIELHFAFIVVSNLLHPSHCPPPLQMNSLPQTSFIRMVFLAFSCWCKWLHYFPALSRACLCFSVSRLNFSFCCLSEGSA